MKTQYDTIGKLISRKRGATALELQEAAHSTCVHKRLHEMKQRGWRITRKDIPGKTHGRYFGIGPA